MSKHFTLRNAAVAIGVVAALAFIFGPDVVKEWVEWAAQQAVGSPNG